MVLRNVGFYFFSRLSESLLSFGKLYFFQNYIFLHALRSLIYFFSWNLVVIDDFLRSDFIIGLNLWLIEKFFVYFLVHNYFFLEIVWSWIHCVSRLNKVILRIPCPSFWSGLVGYRTLAIQLVLRKSLLWVSFSQIFFISVQTNSLFASSAHLLRTSMTGNFFIW